MLKFMRKNKTARNMVLAFVCLAMVGYLFMGLGGARTATAPDDVITKLGSSKVKVRDVYMARAQTKQQFSRFQSDQFDQDFIDQYAASGLISQAMMLDTARQAGISVSDGELKDWVIFNRTYKDTYIDDEQWANYIRRQYNEQVGTYENYVKNNQMRLQKVRSLFTVSTYVSEQDILDRFEKNNRKVKLEMFLLNTFDVKAQVNLDKDEDLKKFFDENQDAFMTGDQRQIQFITFPVNDYQAEIEVAEADMLDSYNQNKARYLQQERVRARHILIKTENQSEEEALTKITGIKKELDEGLDFVEAAKKYSEDGSKDNGGDLGFFSRGRMVPPFENAAFAMAVGDISAPVKSQFGYHIIKKEAHEQERVRPFDEVKNGIRSTLVGTKAKEYVMGLAATFRQMVADGKSFDEAAEEKTYTLHVSPPFDDDNQSNLGDVLRNNFQVRRAVFALTELNEVSQPIDANTQVVVAQWVNDEPPRQLLFEEDKNRIKRQAENLAGKVFITKLFDEVRAAAEAEPEKAFTEFKGDRDFLKDNHFKTTEFVDAQSLPWEIKRDDLDFEEEIYALEPGSFLSRIETSQETRFALVRLEEKKVPDSSKFVEERFAIAQSLRQESSTDLLGNYLFHKQKELDPDDSKSARITASFK